MSLARTDRAGVIAVREGRLALIERVRDGRTYWVLPGGGVEPGETIEAAALREAAEELGVPVTLGKLRVHIVHHEDFGVYQRQWYFDVTVESDEIFIAGPELTHAPERGTYRAVWVPLAELDSANTLPSAVVQLVVDNAGVWPDAVNEIDERAQQ